MWIKICGNTRLEDCQHAVAHGADAVGFVFAPGKRTVTAHQVAAIVERLPSGVEKVGVFTSRNPQEIHTAALEAGLTGLQLHGTPDRGLLESLRELSARKLIQVLHWNVDLPAEAQREPLLQNLEALNTWDLVEAVLVDSQTASASGGTGTPFDWAAVAPLLKASQRPVIAAGGLRPETVASAIAVLDPWGVDVSSGVESAPGVKDLAKMRLFIEQARTAAARRSKGE